MVRRKAPEKGPLWYVDACRKGAWHLEVSKRDNPGDRAIIPFKCRSWRHRGECCRWRGAQDFRRIETAIGKRQDWTLLVLTYDQAKEDSIWKCYKSGLRRWDTLRKRLVRQFGKFDYIQTWERHRSGYPHVNVLVGNAMLWDLAKRNWVVARELFLMPNVVHCGFGPVILGGVLRDPSAMAGYLVKLARELAGAAAKDQVPVNAPRHFRRLRATQGLLPPPYKDCRLTGTLHFCTPADLFERYCWLETGRCKV